MLFLAELIDHGQVCVFSSDPAQTPLKAHHRPNTINFGRKNPVYVKGEVGGGGGGGGQSAMQVVASCLLQADTAFLGGHLTLCAPFQLASTGGGDTEMLMAIWSRLEKERLRSDTEHGTRCDIASMLCYPSSSRHAQERPTKASP